MDHCSLRQIRMIGKAPSCSDSTRDPELATRKSLRFLRTHDSRIYVLRSGCRSNPPHRGGVSPRKQASHRRRTMWFDDTYDVTQNPILVVVECSQPSAGISVEDRHNGISNGISTGLNVQTGTGDVNTHSCRLTRSTATLTKIRPRAVPLRCPAQIGKTL